jgi:hypothetical protein
MANTDKQQSEKEDSSDKDFEKGFHGDKKTDSEDNVKYPNSIDDAKIKEFIKSIQNNESIDSKEASKIIDSILKKAEPDPDTQKQIHEAVDEKKAPEKSDRPDSRDYDMAGFEKAVAEGRLPQHPEGEDVHYPDNFKMPNHITFSDQSDYSNEFEKGGKWVKGGADQSLFIPSEHNLKNTPPEKIAEYFANYEKEGTYVLLPDGTVVGGSK